jgi:uncharacterized protein YkwD
MSMEVVRLTAAVAALAAALAVATLAGSSTAAAAPLMASTASRVTAVTGFAQQALARLNTVRAGQGLRPLRLSVALAKAAGSHARSMARRGYFSHSSGGRGASSRIAQYYRGSPVGEVILWRSPGVSAAKAIAMWLASPSHRAVLLHPSFRDIGFAAVQATNAPGIYHGLDVTIAVADLGGG